MTSCPIGTKLDTVNINNTHFLICSKYSEDQKSIGIYFIILIFLFFIFCCFSPIYRKYNRVNNNIINNDMELLNRDNVIV